MGKRSLRLARAALVPICVTGLLLLAEAISPALFERLGVNTLFYDIALSAAGPLTRAPAADEPRFVFLDFYTPSQEALRQDVAIDRRDLARLVAAVGATGAPVIVLDASLAGTGPADDDLERALRKSRADVLIPALLTQSESEGCSGAQAERESQVRRLSAQRMLRARDPGPVWIASDDLGGGVDSRLRTTCLFTRANRAEDGRSVRLPSTALLAVALWHERMDADAGRRRTAPCDLWTQAIAAADDARRDTSPAPSPCPDSTPTGASVRVEFSAVRPPPGPRYAPWVRRISVDASTISGGFAPDLFDARTIVVIGSTGSLARDLTSTPLGRLYGAEVIINEIDSIARHGDNDAVEHLGDPVNIALELCLSALGGLMFFVLFEGAGCLRRKILRRVLPSAQAGIPHPMRAAARFLCVIVGGLVCIAIVQPVTMAIGLFVGTHLLSSGHLLDLSGLFFALLIETGAHLHEVTGSANHH